MHHPESQPEAQPPSIPSTADLLKEFESTLSGLNPDGSKDTENNVPHTNESLLTQEPSATKLDQGGDEIGDGVTQQSETASWASRSIPRPLSTAGTHTANENESNPAAVVLTGDLINAESAPMPMPAVTDLLQDFETTLNRLAEAPEEARANAEPDRSLLQGAASDNRALSPQVETSYEFHPVAQIPAGSIERYSSTLDGSERGSHQTEPDTSDLMYEFEETLKRLSGAEDGNESIPPSIAAAIPSEHGEVVESANVGAASSLSEHGRLSAETTALVHELEEAKEQLKRSLVGNNELQKSLETLREEAHSARCEKVAAVTALQKFEEQKELVLSFNNGLLEQISSLEKNMKEKELLVRDGKEKYDTLVAQKTSLESQLNQARQEKEQLEVALSESRAAIVTSEARVAEAVDSVMRMKVEIDVLVQSKDDEKRASALREEKLAEENEGLIDELIKTRAACEEASARLEEKSALILGFEEERKKHLQDNRILTRSLEEAQADAAARVAQLEESMTVNDRLIVNMKMQMDSLRGM
ncbi:unknown protein [Seminavis robusta]|uniref:Uncharacterized protein n=1 Tax=Seminavis robusta TaxID=568900 RepID=A0A9N8HWV1_9STRA|nr:unknown protein [Seminavis robusta]|eukprot:Sro2314_g322950.1 n/a (532) ;mRNA; r:14328-15923